jgi:hypothetical protein
MGRPIIFLIILLTCVTSVLAHSNCATAELFQNLRDHARTQVTPKQSRVLYSDCSTEDYYDSVYTKKTSHFQIFYTLNGPHKTTAAYVDTLANALEDAWIFHVKKSGMHKPLGDSISYHYQKPVDSGLYPVEIVEMTLFRDIAFILRNRCVEGCYAITIPSDKEPFSSTLLIENDFTYPNQFNSSKDSVITNEKTCYYNSSKVEMFNSTYNYSYAKKWEKALRVTTAHELYHAIQIHYLDPKTLTFWFEASAAGVEEVTNPDVDDYIQYIPYIAKSVGKPLNEIDNDYSLCILYLFLYNHVSPNADKFIWESFAKNPLQPFEYHLKQLAQKKGLSADSLFHEFAVKLAFSGKKANLASKSFLINKDQSNWPEFKHTPTKSLATLPETNEFSFNFYTNGAPDLSHFMGRASVAIVTGDSYRIRFLPTINSIDSAFNEINNTVGVDSTIWILSRFNEEEKLPYKAKDSTLRAYPTPWRHGTLCFTPLPQNKDFIEIRNRRGNLVNKIKYDSYTHCIEESEVKSMMVPGVYRFRAGNSGKLKDFIIVY